MLSIFRSRRGRRAATAAILPFIESSRTQLGGIPESAWRNPYLIGFIVRLITLFATREVGSLDDDALASVQAGGWRDLTGLSGAVIGEDVCFLSAGNDSRFIEGCVQAEAFFDELTASAERASLALGGMNDHLGAPEWAEGADSRAFWSRCFEAHVK